jgi:hypothetical protein
MPRIIHTVSLKNIYTEALPRICIARNCLNTAEKDENYCTSCIEKGGIKRGFLALVQAERKQSSSRKTLKKLGKRLSSYIEDCTTIYCIRMGANGPIKIGRTKDVDGRVNGLQTGNPYQLVPIAEVMLPAEMEVQLHAYLDEYRMQGEWFTPSSEVLEIVELIKNSDLSTILSKFEARIAENEIQDSWR